MLWGGGGGRLPVIEHHPVEVVAVSSPLGLLPCFGDWGQCHLGINTTGLVERLQLEFHDHFDELWHLCTGNCFKF